MNNLVSSKILELSPREDIEEKTRGEIEAYISGRGKTRIHAGARNLSLNVSDDYGNRFLVELIQNAHDAHDGARTDGEIAVVLDPDEGDYGCLYVANRGNGFRKNNLEAITNIALSSKPVNESIGNKGLGFRSVLQICQWPEIYSVQGEGGSGEFDGYCFRFAGIDDIEGMLDGLADRAMAAEILENMPCWYLPVYANDRPGQVNRFAAEGFASVVRMPLASAGAHEAVVDQISELLALETPLHLFLDRISRIWIEHEQGQVESLERRMVDRWSIPGGVEVQRIAIGSDEYLVAGTEIDSANFREQLEGSLARKEVPEAWRNWQGSARVSTAIRLGHSVEKGLLYCFLPLGEAGAAPFAGYINANFYTKMDRRSVNDGVGLNRFFISVAAEVNCRVIRFLIEQNWYESPGAVIDLLCWNGAHKGEVHRYLESDGGGITEQALLPARAVDGRTRWVKAAEAYMWDEPEDACLSAEAIAREADAAILSDRLTPLQKQSLRTFFASMEVWFDPAPSTVAHWIERVALKMLETQADPERWATFYDEVALHMRSNPRALFGKRFLLSVNGELIASEPVESAKRRRAPDIYFPPVMTPDADADDAETKSLLPLEQLPSSLKRGFALLSREVPWLNADGGYRPARPFFLEAKLVREYDTGEVIRTLASVTRSDVAGKTKEQALEWAFRLWSSGRSLAPKETRAAGVHVPMRSGWGSAESAMFGSGWTAPNGKRLEQILKAGGEYSDELENAQANLLPRFGDWPIHHGKEEDWIAFLQAAGVRDCLRPIGGEKLIQLDYQPHILAHQLVATVDILKTAMAALWRSDLIEAAKTARFPSRQYRSELLLWRLPGQVDHEDFPQEFRKDYAVQVVRALPELKPEHLEFRIFRPDNPSTGASPAQWPTPLFSLLKGMAWLPVSRGRGETRFVAPCEAWSFYTDEEAAPRFMELIVPSVDRELNGEALDQLRDHFGVRILNDEADATDALSAYADRASEGLSDPTDVRRFRELFGRLWTQVAPLDQELKLDHLPVMVGANVQALPFDHDEMAQDESSDKAHFVDEDDPAKRQLLEELAQPLFDFGKADIDDTWGWLEAFAPSRFVRMSHEKLEVHVDGVRFDETDDAPLLTEVFGTWIADFIVCAAEHKGGAFFTKTQNNLGKVKRAALALRLRTGKRLQISMGGEVRDLPLSLHGAVVLRRSSYAILIAQLDGSEPSLDLLARVSDQLALALQQPMLANGLDASFLRLEQLMRGGEGSCPDDADIASVLGTDVQTLEQTRRFARADLSTHIRFAVLLAAYMGMESSQEQLQQLIQEDELLEDAAHQALEPIAAALGISVPHLVELLGLVSDVRELMQTFELKLGDLNEAIRRVGGGFKPISNEALHRRQLKAYLSQAKSRIIENLRPAFLETFDQYGDLAAYARVRDALETIQPNPIWYEQFNDLSDEVLEAHVHAWLIEQGISVSAGGIDLPPLLESRETNTARLRRFWDRCGKVLSSWVHLEGTHASPTLVAAWSDPALKRHEFTVLAGQTGWLDFRFLEDAAIAKWLVFHGAWPSGKSVSMDFADWGVSEDEIRNREAQSERDRAAQIRRRQQLVFGGREFSAQKENLDALIDAVKEGLKDVDALADINSSIRRLADFDEPSRGGSSGGGASGSSNGMTNRLGDSSLSEDQKRAVGLVGELFAKEWIRRYHSEKHGYEPDDECWVSGYRNAVLGTTSGNDGLGYDFAVQLKSTTYYYEVKASTGDFQTFEMGPTEIAAAQRYKADHNNKYRILYVANATDPKRAKISLLPNPFSRAGEKKLRPVGRGSVTYAFEMAG